jgi:predicted nucleic acid-binding protein
MSVLIDSNVLIDLVDFSAAWHQWSADRIADIAGGQAPLAINPIIYAEVSIPFRDAGTVEDLLSPFVREPLPSEAAFLAGKASQAYRLRGGARAAPPPDFFIGAHALVGGHRLLTRDAARDRTYFPEVTLIAP